MRIEEEKISKVTEEDISKECKLSDDELDNVTGGSHEGRKAFAVYLSVTGEADY